MKIGDRFNPEVVANLGSFLPEGLSRYRGLSPGAKVVWGRLYRYLQQTQSASPSVEFLAGEVGLGATQTRRYLHELIEEGFLGFDQPLGEVRRYFFLWHEAFEGETGAARVGGFGFGDCVSEGDFNEQPRLVPSRRQISPKIRFEILARDGFRCQYCGGRAPEVVLEIDHIVPVVEGGTDKSNLITACQTCNNGKGSTRIE